jgi:hypothetical protein
LAGILPLTESQLDALRIIDRGMSRSAINMAGETSSGVNSSSEEEELEEASILVEIDVTSPKILVASISSEEDVEVPISAKASRISSSVGGADVITE